jgi:hypothetical protein
MIVFFFDGKWSQWGFFRKCSLLIHWWPEIARKLKKAKPATFFYVPLNWSERSKIRKVSTNDPQKLKIEKQIKAGDRIRCIRKKAADAQDRRRPDHQLHPKDRDAASAGELVGRSDQPFDHAGVSRPRRLVSPSTELPHLYQSP